MQGGDIPIIANDNHAEDGAGAGDRPGEGIDVAPELAPHPVALHEPVQDHRHPLGRHHHQVGEGKVYYEHVARRTQGVCLGFSSLEIHSDVFVFMARNLNKKQ